MPSNRLQLTKLVLSLLPACLPAAGLALEFQSVAPVAAVLTAAPNPQAKKLYVVSQGTPFEVVLTQGEWVKVRDRDGLLAWIDKKQLSPRRSVVVIVDRTGARAKPDDSATLVFEAERDVLLDLLEPPTAGWAKVRHRDGLSGYLRLKDIWGL